MDDKRITKIAHKSTESEKAIERKLIEAVKAWGGVCLKYHNGQSIGYPDRVVLLPHGVTLWVEVKSKGQKPRKAQALRIEQLQRLGHYATYIDNTEAIGQLLQDYQKWKADHEVHTTRLPADSHAVDN